MDALLYFAIKLFILCMKKLSYSASRHWWGDRFVLKNTEKREKERENSKKFLNEWVSMRFQRDC